MAQSVKNPPAMQETQVDPWAGKMPWRRKWQPTAVFLPGQSMDKGAWQATVLGVARVRYDLVTKPRIYL